MPRSRLSSGLTIPRRAGKAEARPRAIGHSSPAAVNAARASGKGITAMLDVVIGTGTFCQIPRPSGLPILPTQLWLTRAARQLAANPSNAPAEVRSFSAAALCT
jgi:hypothetical protein